MRHAKIEVAPMEDSLSRWSTSTPFREKERQAVIFTGSVAPAKSIRSSNG